MILTFAFTKLGVSFDNPAMIINLGGGYNTFAPTVAINAQSSEVPSGAIDGVNRVFNVAHVPDSKIFALMLNGMDQIPGSSNDFTLTGSVITFHVAPIPTDEISVTYTY
jgi:hypothetical protein